MTESKATPEKQIFEHRMEYTNTDIISEVLTDELETSSALNNDNSFSTHGLSTANETVPPKAGSEVVSTRPRHTSEPELTCLTCCCLYGRDETFSQSVSSSRDHYTIAASKALRRFLSSVAVYAYVLVLTFLIVLLLLAELLIGLNIIIVPSDSVTSSRNLSFIGAEPQSRQSHVLYVIHWTNFSLLCLCLFEVVLRLFAWKLDLVRSLVAVWDSAAVIVSFVVNIVTTLAAGYDSPFNSLSLLVIFRFVRIFSLIGAFVRRVKREYQDKLNKAESNSAHMQVGNQRLHRQISEKDYEIRQLRAHLGKLDEEACENVMKELNKKKSQNNYDIELEQAIALSKKEYEEANGGYDNPNFSPKPKIDDVFVPDIMIHHRQNSVQRDKGAGPSTSGTQPSSSGDTGAKTAKEKPDFNLSHGELHSGADVESHNTAQDTTLLLGSGQTAESDHWTVGYCIVQSPHLELLSEKSKWEKEHSSKNDKMDVVLDQTDEGIGEETSPARSQFVKIHSRSFSGVVSSGADDTLSDQGCVSATSLCSESGYQSDDKYISARPASTGFPEHADEDCVSVCTVQSIPRSSSRARSPVTEVSMVELKEMRKDDEDDSEDEEAL